LETWGIVEDVLTQEPKIFEEEYVTLHHRTYHKNSKKLLIEKVNMKIRKCLENGNQKLIFMDFHPKKLYNLTRQL
jgi:hypothetical protein